MANARNNIGNIYYLQENYSEALINYTAALKIQTETGDKQGIAGSYTNIGEVYRNQHKLNEALANQTAAVKIQEEIGNQDGLSNAYSNIGLVYFDKGNYSLAVENYLTALHLKEKTGDEQGMAWSYASLSEAYIKLKKYSEAESYAVKSLQLATELGELDDVKQADFNLSEIYEKTGKPQKALEYFKAFVAVRDSLFNEENTKKTVQQQMQYDFDKKETAAKLEQEKRDAVTSAENKKQQIIIAAVSVGLILMLILAGVILRSLRLHQKKNQIISHQKDLVEEKQKEILDSIHYAKRIQQALLTSVKYIERYLGKNFFILYKPKDIVSGDFYYALSHKLPGSDKELFYLCTADCTGHGVPGAFMSMLGISHLNESIIEKNISMPHEILNAMRSEIIRSLNPEGSEEESKDGMDCVLCCYDFKAMKLYFAAANNPVWLVRNGTLQEYKPDKMPVGKYHDETVSFTLQTIDLQKGDIIYTFTDGYADQFGGKKGKKFKFKQLEEMLFANSNLPLEEQKELLAQAFENWKGKLEQVDDVCLIGVKV
jgi:serine phosphatase RsbU (regulator of sigma subunit)